MRQIEKLNKKFEDVQLLRFGEGVSLQQLEEAAAAVVAEKGRRKNRVTAEDRAANAEAQVSHLVLNAAPWRNGRRSRAPDSKSGSLSRSSYLPTKPLSAGAPEAANESLLIQ